MKLSKTAQLILIIILSFILLSIVGCAAHREKRRAAICATCPEKSRTDSISSFSRKESIRDSTIKTPIDSSWYEAYIKCLDGKPVIINSKQKDGKRSSLSVEIDSDGILSVNCKADSLSQVIHIKDTEIERLTKLNKESTIPVKKHRFMENVFYYIGGFTCFLICIVAVVLLVLMAMGNRVFGKRI
jgi:hypothetical protein